MAVRSENGEKTPTSPLSSNGPSKSALRVALPQILAVVVKNTVLVQLGMTLGFATILIPSLSGPDDTFSLSHSQLSWISSINYIFIPVGALASGVITQTVGRKRAMQFVSVPFLISWTLLAYSSQVWQLYLGLSIAGLAGGLLEAPVLTYVAEITQPHLRGMLGSTSTVSVMAGLLVEFLFGSMLTWRGVALTSAAFPLLSFLLLFLVPESPIWLTMKGRCEEARRSLAWLRGWTTVEEIEAEYQVLCLGKNSRRTNSTREDNVSKKSDSAGARFLSLYTSSSFLHPYLLVTFAFFILHFTGMTSVQAYAVQIFHTLRTPIDKYVATLLIGAAELLGTLGCLILVRFTGKRVLFFVSAIGSSFCFALVGIHAYLNGINSLIIAQGTGEVVESSWLPTVFIILGTLFSNAGTRIIPWILVGEVFPKETRAAGSGLTACTGYIFGFIVNKVFLWMVFELSLPGTFWFYSSVGVLGVVVFYFLLPETEGKPLDEIEDHFKGIVKLDNRVRRKRRTGGIANPAYKSTENVGKHEESNL